MSAYCSGLILELWFNISATAVSGDPNSNNKVCDAGLSYSNVCREHESTFNEPKPLKKEELTAYSFYMKSLSQHLPKDAGGIRAIVK